MILGLISFGLFVVQSNKSIALDDKSKHTLEVVHIVLFVVSLLYSVFIGVIVLLSQQISRR
jgi:hypothetical protein